MLTLSSGALPTIGNRNGERPVHQAGSPFHSQLRPSADVKDCISAPRLETSTLRWALAMRVVADMTAPLGAGNPMTKTGSAAIK